MSEGPGHWAEGLPALLPGMPAPADEERLASRPGAAGATVAGRPASPAPPGSPVWAGAAAPAGPHAPAGPPRPGGTMHPAGFASSATPAQPGFRTSYARFDDEWVDHELAGYELPGRDRPGRQRSGRRMGGAARLSGRRLFAAATGLALVSALAGGLVGGYIATRSAPAGADPTYSLGAASPNQTARPASSVAGLAARVLPSVVTVKVDDGQGTGSGFIVSGGYIITDNHVVTLDGRLANASMSVTFNGGRTVSATLVGRDPYSDIAVIRPAGTAILPALPLGNSSSVEVGDPVIAVGAPLGLAETVTSGIVSAVNRPVEPGSGTSTSPQVYFDAIQTDAPINPGNSGGPLVNARGQVIGVDAAIDTLGDPLTGSQGGSIGLGFAIPINQARRVATELIRTGHAAHSVLGAVINIGYGGTGAQIVPVRPGAAAPVTPGGPAAQAGLQPGDVIVRFAGLPITDGNSLLDAIRSQAPGSRVSVTYVRGGISRTAWVALGSATS